MDSSTQIIPKINYLKCEICEKIFTTKDFKIKHLSIVHGEMKTFECNICLRVFGGQQSLSTHIKHSHKKDKKKHKCDSCEKQFTYSGHLNNHMKTFHEGQRNYVCKNCGKSLTMQANLKITPVGINEKGFVNSNFGMFLLLDYRVAQI